jgi:lipid-A-disaccharide synthase
VLAGEASGDNLGAGVMRALREQLGDHGEVHFIGVGGTRMREQGLHALASIDELSVNGFRDPIVRLPQLIRLLRRLIREFSAADIDGFLGVDFNVFNFLLEAALKRRGIKTAHYVSPSVYAWRSGRTRRVAKSADLVLCLYPFEPAFYDALPVRAEFVGHPLADEIAPDAGGVAQRDAARKTLGLDGSANTVLAVLPGSRNSEVALMVDDFLHAAELFAQRHAPGHQSSGGASARKIPDC